MLILNQRKRTQVLASTRVLTPDTLGLVSLGLSSVVYHTVAILYCSAVRRISTLVWEDLVGQLTSGISGGLDQRLSLTI